MGNDKEEQEMDILKVSSKSNPNSVAGALAGVLRERGNAKFRQLEPEQLIRQ